MKTDRYGWLRVLAYLCLLFFGMLSVSAQGQTHSYCPTDGVCTWTGNQTGPYYNSGGTIVDVGVCVNGAADTTAITTAVAKLGSILTPPTQTFAAQTTNKRQGTLRFPHNSTCQWNVASEILMPPGSQVSLNGSTLSVTNAAGSGFAWEYNSGGSYGYGTWFGGVFGGFIQGPGSGTSTGSGVFCDACNAMDFQNLQIRGFKFGVRARETQYSDFRNIWADANVIGFYVTARPTATTLVSIDNHFTAITADRNTKYGIWCQTCDSSQFDKVDASRNGVADVVLGSQLVKYISAISVSAGGTTCGISTTIPLTITDGSGLYAQAYAKTNGSGVITSAFVVDAGQGYVSPVVTAPACGGSPTLVATVSDDTGLGDWDGVSSVARGNLVFNSVKTEHNFGVDGPISGYAVLINGTATTAIRKVTFNNFRLLRSAGGDNAYYRAAFNQGLGNTFNYPADSSSTFDSLSNPAVSGDVSIFRNVSSQGLAVRWGAAATSSDSSLYKYVIDNTGAASYAFNDAVIGFTAKGFSEVLATHSASSFSGAIAEESFVNGDANATFQRTIAGLMQWGAGGASALDTGLSRGAAGQLNVGNGAAGDASGTIAAASVKIGSNTGAQLVASGTSTFTTTAVGAGACQTTVTTAATNALTTDTIVWAYATAPTAATDGVLHIVPYVTANNVNFMRCNASAGSITPTALVINWKVIR